MRVTAWDHPLVVEVVRGADAEGWWIEVDNERFTDAPVRDFHDACFQARQATAMMIDRLAMQATQAQALDIGPIYLDGKPNPRE